MVKKSEKIGNDRELKISSEMWEELKKNKKFMKNAHRVVSAFDFWEGKYENVINYMTELLKMGKEKEIEMSEKEEAVYLYNLATALYRKHNLSTSLECLVLGLPCAKQSLKLFLKNRAG